MRVARWRVRVVLGLLPLLSACGGSGGAGSQATGRVAFQVRWPESGRLLPTAAASVAIHLAYGTTWSAQQVVARPAAGGTVTATFDAVPVGLLTATATAYPTADATGVAQASGAVQFESLEGQTVSQALTLASLITAVAVSPSTSNPTVGQPVSLTATARNAGGEVVLVPDQATWSIVSGAECVTLASSRATSAYQTSLTATGAGEVVVQCSFDEAAGAPRSGTATLTVQQAAAQPVWQRQYGTTGYDYGYGVAVDGAGNAYLAGSLASGSDACLAKYSPGGSQLWLRQFGAAGADDARDVAWDGANAIYTAGQTAGDLAATNAGGLDVWLAKYDLDGQPVWVRQFGTAAHEYATAVAPAPGGGVYVAGLAEGPLGGPHLGDADFFLARYDAAGTQVWIRQFGSGSLEGPNGLASDAAGNAVVVGWTRGLIGATQFGDDDMVVVKYSAAGDQLWAQQLGTSASDGLMAVSVDGAGAIAVVGHTEGALAGPSAGQYDVAVARFDAAGALLWTRQLGTLMPDRGAAIAAAPSGNLVVAGATYRELAGAWAGSQDIWVAAYNSSGARRWQHQFGTLYDDLTGGAAVDPTGDVYLVGSTAGSLAAANAGDADLLIARYLGGLN